MVSRRQRTHATTDQSDSTAANGQEPMSAAYAAAERHDPENAKT